MAELSGGEGRARTRGDAGAERLGGVGDTDRDGAHREAVVGGEAARGVRGEGRQHGGGRRGVVVVGAAVLRRVRGGEEERERSRARAQQVGGVRGVPRGEVGVRGQWHPEREGEAAGSGGGVGAPELDVVEVHHMEAVGAGEAGGVVRGDDGRRWVQRLGCLESR